MAGVARPQLITSSTIEAAQVGIGRLNALLNEPANQKQVEKGGGVWPKLRFLRGLVLGTVNDGSVAAAAG